jgi:hypothetical protein
MTDTPSARGRRGKLVAAAASALLAVVGVAAVAVGIRGSDGPPTPTASSTSLGSAASSDAQPAPAAPSSPVSTAPRFGRFLPASRPTMLDIASIGVHSGDFVDLDVTSDGTIAVPGTAHEVGFYVGGPTPGQLGPAVMAAHVDSTQGPGVFYRLGQVKPGAAVRVSRADGSVLQFVVDKVALYPKDRFPTDEVYRGTFDRAEIRLVTCGGTFDKVRHYLDNVVVFGHLVGVA